MCCGFWFLLLFGKRRAAVLADQTDKAPDRNLVTFAVPILDDAFNRRVQFEGRLARFELRERLAGCYSGARGNAPNQQLGTLVVGVLLGQTDQHRFC